MITEPTAYVRCTRLEIAAGWTYGTLERTPLPENSQTPRAALDAVLRPALEGGRCFVTFSGGRDSSAVLAAATDLARREGHPDPVPVTRVYPDLPETDESSWQCALIEHLGLAEWIRLEFRSGESDLLGEPARDGLRRRGLLWPPALHAHGAMFQQLGGGSLLTGEGGDAVIGMRRGTVLAAVRFGRIPPSQAIRPLAGVLLPRRVREARARRAMSESVQRRWLRPAAMAEHIDRAARDMAAEPLRYDRATWAITGLRSFAVISHNHALTAAEYGLAASDPLLDPGFVGALAHAGGRWGFLGRTATMKALFGDVLPRRVLERTSKASFNLAHRGAATQDFARSWDGSGVDHELVDADRLRAVWLSDQPTMAAGTLLHSAWLAQAGLGHGGQAR